MKRANKLLDVNLNLQDQSVQIGKLLARVDFTQIKGYGKAAHARVETSAWYNGRERGIALTLNAFNRPTFVIAFSECRNSDSIVIDNWCPEAQHFLNPPTIADFTDDAYYKRRKSVPCEEYAEAVIVIISLIEGWMAGKEGVKRV